MVDVIVTGAAGRIGRVVTPALRAAGLSVRLTDVIDRADVFADYDYRQADMIDGAAMADVMDGGGALLHLAGIPGVRAWDVLERVNVSGTRTVFDAAVAAGIRHIVYASTNHVCGFNPADVALTPDTPLAPDSPYGVTKLFGENLLAWLCDQHGLSGISLRICSFLPMPTQARHLKTWLSHADTARLSLAALGSPRIGHRIVWGLSNNRRGDVDAAHWDAIGYAPADDAERFVDDLAASGIDTTAVSEWPNLGGNLAVSTASPNREGVTP